jgi:hypothetical protein
MSRRNKVPLPDRIASAAEAALAEQGYASFVDVLLGVRWLDPNTAASWRRGQIDCLEGAIQTAPERLSQARLLFRAWAEAKGLSPTPAAYVARTPQRSALIFASTATLLSRSSIGRTGSRQRFRRRSASVWSRTRTVRRSWWSSGR